MNVIELIFGPKDKTLKLALFALVCMASFLSPAQANDNFPGTTITGNSGSLNASNGAATGQSGEPLTYNGGSLNTMWYSWTAPSNGTLTVQTCGGTSDFDTTLQTFTGTAVGALGQVATNDDSCGLQSVNTVAVTTGTIYRIQVDGYGSATGNFTLSWSFAGATGADLSLTQTVSTTSPQSGVRLDYTLTVTNNSASTVTATGIQVTNILDAALIYRSQTGTGTYDPATSIWTVGTLAPGASAAIVISVANNAVPGTTISNYAQITASSASDPDSVVNNGSTTEDDDESTSITIANFLPAGTPPTLTCPVTSAVFDWDTQAWTSGAVSGSFNVANIGPMALNFTGATNRFIADPATTTATPVRNTSTTGGAAGQNSLMLAVDLASASESVNATWTFTNGVSGLQFTLADIDLLYGQFEDRVTVTGSYKGVTVTPILTNFGANTVTGNSATATALATNSNADGNVRVTFSSPVDTVVVNYGSTANAPADPGIQAIALMDMTACGAATDLSLSKQVSNGSPAPGASISFTLTANNNTANAMDTSGVTVTDVLPAGFTFGSATGSGSYNSATGLWTIGALTKGATATLTINGTVNASAGTTVNNIAQITANSLSDPDSTVNNGVTSEDDYASASFTVSSVLAAPTCPAGGTNQIITNGTFATGTGPSWPNWTAGAVWFGTGAAAVDNDTTSGTLSQSGLSGLKFGPSGAGGAVIQLSQWWRNGAPAASSSGATLTVSLGGTNYAIVTTPTGGGTSATVTYLNGASGNLTSLTEFVSTGWRINIPTTVNATGALSFAYAPGGGTLDDDFEIDNVTLYTCTPGQLSVTKISNVVNDYISANNPKAVPGALVRYCILVTNTGTVATSNVSVSDPLPGDVTFVPGSMLSASDCSTATTAEDDNNADGDENDPFGMSISGTTVTGTATTLGVGDSFAMIFNAAVD